MSFNRLGGKDVVTVQWCSRPLFGKSDCGPWETFEFPRPPVAETKAGPNKDQKVVVLGKKKLPLPGAKDKVVDVPVNFPPGATDPARCQIGFVWRVARPDDLVCVTPERREAVRQENRVAASRRVGK